MPRGKRLAAARVAADAPPPAFALFRQQEAFVRDLSKISAAITGLGGSKTFSGAIKVLSAMDAFPGLRVLVTAPTFTQLEKGTMLSLREIWDPRKILYDNKNDHEIAHENGSLVWYQSADDPSHFRALQVGMLWIDEAGYVSRDAYLTALGRVRQQGMPLQTILTSTPVGRNWLYDLLEDRPRVKSTIEHTGDYASIRRWADGITLHRWPTRANTFLPEDYIRSLESAYEGTDLYAQDLLGEFVTFRGLVYHYPTSAIVDYGPRPPFRQVVGGVDFGSTSVYAHATAAVIWVEDDAGRAWAVDEFYARPARGTDLAEWLYAKQQEWGVEWWSADRTQFQAITMLAQAGINIHPTPPYQEVSVLDGITIWQRRFATDGVRINKLACPNLVTELQSYSWKEPKEGTVAQREPVKIKDDVMDAGRYGIVHLDRAFHAPDVFDNVPLEWSGGIDDDDETDYLDINEYRERRG